MGTALDTLLALLDVEALEVNLFRGRSPDEDTQRVFGGQVAGQALVAAGRTVEPERDVHSLHAYFLRPGDPEVPIVYEVDRLRDGRSFTTRRVVAIQHGRAIFNLQASFQIREVGPEHQYEAPEAPDPESLPTFGERLERHRDRFGPEFDEWAERDRPIDSRHCAEPPWLDPSPRGAEQLVWIRADGDLPDERFIHECVVTYASDFTLLDTAMLPHDMSSASGGYQIASLDHAMWFHRPFRADEWLLYHQKTPSASGARGIAEGFLYTQGGDLVVTVIQEGLIRPLETPTG
ncbi:MAG: acyl-CoA thioesterase II [Acidimicrobiia bacterium]